MAMVYLMRKLSTAGPITDTFDRANSSTGFGTASDGGTWTEDATPTTTWPVFGIVSNEGYLVSFADQFARARRDLGSASCTVQVTDSRSNTNGYSYIWFAYSPYTGTTANDSGYALQFDSSGTISVLRLDTAMTITGLGSVSVTSWTGSSTVLKVTYNQGTGVITVYQGGVSKGTVTDGSPLAGTWVGLGATQNRASTGETWNDFTAV